MCVALCLVCGPAVFTCVCVMFVCPGLSIAEHACDGRASAVQVAVIDLSVGDLQMYGSVRWCNPADLLGRLRKKEVELESTVFVFRTGVVFLCFERQKRRRPGRNQVLILAVRLVPSASLDFLLCTARCLRVCLPSAPLCYGSVTPSASR